MKSSYIAKSPSREFEVKLRGEDNHPEFAESALRQKAKDAGYRTVDQARLEGREFWLDPKTGDWVEYFVYTLYAKNPVSDVVSWETLYKEK